nr:hypothetical protein [Tanacetum cinerariifolium]
MRRVGKGFSGVETSLFEGMLVAQEVVEEGDAEVHGEKVNAGDATEGDVSAAHDEVPTIDEEPSIPSPTPPTPLPQPSHDIPSSQVQLTPPQSPQPQQDAGIPMNLFQEVMDTCTTLSRRVEHLELDKIAQALEITKLKRRVKKLERRNKGRKVESQAEIYKIDLEHANKVLRMQEDESEPAEVQEVVDYVTTAKIITEVVTTVSETIAAASENITTTEAQVPAATLTAAPSRVTATPSRRKGVVIRVPQEESTTSIIIPAETKSKDKEATPLARKGPVVDYEVINMSNKPYYKIIRADDTHQLYERFSTTKPKNSSDDFLLETLRAMFKKPDIHA